MAVSARTDTHPACSRTHWAIKDIDLYRILARYIRSSCSRFRNEHKHPPEVNQYRKSPVRVAGHVAGGSHGRLCGRWQWQGRGADGSVWQRQPMAGGRPCGSVAAGATATDAQGGSHVAAARVTRPASPECAGPARPRHGNSRRPCHAVPRGLPAQHLHSARCAWPPPSPADAAPARSPHWRERLR